jgi:very-short-patch-repair endonuclease
MSAEDVITQLGIRATSPARTLFDMAPQMSDRVLARTVDDALHSVFLSRADLTAQLKRNPGCHGAKRLRPLVTATDGPSRSDWERSFPAFCRKHGLPRPRLNTIVCGYEVDALFEDEKLIVELDGWAFHASRDAFERDRDRDADTLRAGYPTVRITWQRMTGAAASEARRLEAILAARRGP